MATEAERWDLALRAHRAEHEAMHERGLGKVRIGISGRPRNALGRSWRSWGRSRRVQRVQNRRWGSWGRPSASYLNGGYLSGLGQLGWWESMSPGTKLAIVGLGGLAAGVGLVWAFERAGIPLL